MDAVLLKGSKHLKNATPASLRRELKKGPAWVDIHENEVDVLQEFGITHALFRSIKSSELPIYYELNKTVSILLLRLRFEGTVLKERVYVFAGSGLLVTINCRKQMEAFAQLGKGETSAESALCYLLLTLSEANERLMEELELRAEGIQDKLIRKHEMHVSEVLSFKRTILSVNKVLWHTREILFYLRHCGILEFNPSDRAQLDEAHNSLLYCVDLNSTFREVLTDSLDVYHTIVSNKINKAIKRLTVITVVLAIIATITSIPNTIATILGIPYFPIDAKAKIAEVFGVGIYPWDLILLLLMLGSAIPSYMLFWWWDKVQKEGEREDSTH